MCLWHLAHMLLRGLLGRRGRGGGSSCYKHAYFDFTDACFMKCLWFSQFVRRTWSVCADGPLTNTQIANTLQLSTDMMGPGASPAVRPTQMTAGNLPQVTAAGQAGRVSQTVGSQANHTQLPQQPGQPALSGQQQVSQNLTATSQVCISLYVLGVCVRACVCVCVCVCVRMRASERMKGARQFEYFCL